MSATAYHLTVFRHTGQGYFSFFCKNCHAEGKQNADEHVVSLLRSGGVRWSVVAVPAEALEPRRGPALTTDDVMDFVISLNQANDRLCEQLSKGEQPAR